MLLSTLLFVFSLHLLELVERSEIYWLWESTIITTVKILWLASLSCKSFRGRSTSDKLRKIRGLPLAVWKEIIGNTTTSPVSIVRKCSWNKNRASVLFEVFFNAGASTRAAYEGQNWWRAADLQEPSKRLGSFDFLASNLHWSTMNEEENYV